MRQVSKLLFSLFSSLLSYSNFGPMFDCFNQNWLFWGSHRHTHTLVHTNTFEIHGSTSTLCSSLSNGTRDWRDVNTRTDERRKKKKKRDDKTWAKMCRWHAIKFHITDIHDDKQPKGDYRTKTRNTEMTSLLLSISLSRQTPISPALISHWMIKLYMHVSVIEFWSWSKSFSFTNGGQVSPYRLLIF